MPDVICRRCRDGVHRECDDEVPEWSVRYSPRNACECPNGSHQRHYDAEGQLILVSADG